MKQAIIKLAEEIDISAVGFCTAADYLKRAPSEAAAEILRGKNSVITCAFGYYSGDEPGNISRYARGIDYHTVTMNRMERIVGFLKENGRQAQAFADIGKLNERLLAVLSGIGFRGRNGMIINDRLGSYFFIGYVVTDCEFEPDSEDRRTCCGCGRCVEACPSGALAGGGFLKERCLSEVTQRKGTLSAAEVSALKNAGTAWGCDICQEVCPHNREPEMTRIPEFRENLIRYLDIDESLSNREFKMMYGNRAFAWRGKNILIRNQNIFKKKIKKIKKRY